MARTDPQINIRLPADMIESLEAAAQVNHRSFKAEVLERLERSLLLDIVEAENSGAAMRSRVNYKRIEKLRLEQEGVDDLVGKDRERDPRLSPEDMMQIMQMQLERLDHKLTIMDERQSKITRDLAKVASSPPENEK